MTTETTRANVNIANLFSAENVEGLEISHAGRIRANFRNNLSNIGRYGHKDFERFGNLTPQDPKNLGRQDGWVSLTEEVPHINHLTYGTGTLYVHGEMEIPPYEDDAGAPMIGSNFNATLKDGTQTITADYKTPYSVKSSGDDVDSGYQWGWEVGQTPNEGEVWQWRHMVSQAGGIPVPLPNSTATPTGNNDSEIYVLNNERNNFPWVIINSGAPSSIKTLLNSLTTKNGMSDGVLPSFATQPASGDVSFPPAVNEGISYKVGGIDAIVDFTSPLDI